MAFSFWLLGFPGKVFRAGPCYGPCWILVYCYVVSDDSVWPFFFGAVRLWGSPCVYSCRHAVDRTKCRIPHITAALSSWPLTYLSSVPVQHRHAVSYLIQPGMISMHTRALVTVSDMQLSKTLSLSIDPASFIYGAC